VTTARVAGSIAAIAVAAAAAVGAVTGAAMARQREPHATMLAGAYWSQLRPHEKQIYLAGFLAGAAAEQVRGVAQAAGKAADSLAVSRDAISALRAERALQFRFATRVYSAQIDDFYWWQNHRETPIVDAMIRFNADMLKQQTEGRP
jgi:hypothetical protein